MTGDEEDREAFEEAMQGVEPIERGRRVRPPGRRPRARSVATGDEPPARFALEETAGGWAGVAPGVDRAQLRRLLAGERRIDARVDLHGLDAAAARTRLRAGLGAARAQASRCVLVIHGRGAHSEDEPVLKESLPGWLAEPPLGAAVMAFGPALPRHGGPGASYVLLRRRR